MAYWRERDDVMTRKGQSSRYDHRATVKQAARHCRRQNDRRVADAELIDAYPEWALDAEIGRDLYMIAYYDADYPDD